MAMAIALFALVIVCKHKVANGLHSTDRDQLPVSSSHKPLFLCTPAVAASGSLIQSGIVRFRGYTGTEGR